MRTPAAILLVLACLPAVAAAEPAKEEGRLSAVSVLPDGSELQGVLIPRYDDRRRLVGTLKAESMKLVNREQVAARHVDIRFFRKDGQEQAQLGLKEAMYNQAAGLIRADEAVSLRSERFHADGMGLVYDVNGGDGFLVGPALTWITATRETAMLSRPSPAPAAGFASLMLTSLVMAEDPAATPKDPAVEASRVTREQLAESLAASQAAHDAAAAFLKKAEGVDASNVDAAVPEAKPLDVQPGPNDAVVSCDGGMYFDPDEGVFVYLKNVRVKDPRFSLRGANELKIFLDRKKQPDAGKDGDKPPVDFGEVSRITASGTLVFEQHEAGGDKPIRASGAFFSYEPNKDQVILSGGFPWVVQGGLALRAREANLTLRIQPKAQRFQTEGQWDTILPLDELQKQKPR